MVRIGAPLLESGSALSKDERTYLTTVLATGYLRLGEVPRARQLLTSQWDQLDHGGEFALSLAELLALSAVGDRQTLAHNQTPDSGADGS